MFKKILVPLDRSTIAEQALTTARALAKRGNAKLVLLNVSQPEVVLIEPMGSYPIPAMSRDNLEKASRDYLKAIAGAPEQIGIETSVVVEWGDPASAIIDVALREEVDLIVMSTHGRSGLQRWVLGSITERVLRHAPVAVLALQSGDLPEEFMLTLDGSSLSELAIEPTLALAKLLDAKVTFASVQDMREQPDYDLVNAINPVDDGLAERVIVEWYDRAHTYIKSMVTKYKSHGLELKGAVIEATPADGILTLAEKHNADLIAMTTHGRSGISRWRYGSVTEKILRSANRDMFIIRAVEPVKAEDVVMEMATAT